MKVLVLKIYVCRMTKKKNTNKELLRISWSFEAWHIFIIIFRTIVLMLNFTFSVSVHDLFALKNQSQHFVRVRKSSKNTFGRANESNSFNVKMKKEKPVMTGFLSGQQSTGKKERRRQKEKMNEYEDYLFMQTKRCLMFGYAWWWSRRVCTRSTKFGVISFIHSFIIICQNINAFKFILMLIALSSSHLRKFNLAKYFSFHSDHSTIFGTTATVKCNVWMV